MQRPKVAHSLFFSVREALRKVQGRRPLFSIPEGVRPWRIGGGSGVDCVV